MLKVYYRLHTQGSLLVMLTGTYVALGLNQGWLHNKASALTTILQPFFQHISCTSISPLLFLITPLDSKLGNLVTVNSISPLQTHHQE